MTMRTNRLAVVAACGVALAATGLARAQEPAGDQDPSRADLIKRIAELEASNREVRQRLVDVESRQESSWLTDRRAQEVKALVQEVLADADTRASLSGSPGVAGYTGENFYIADAEGKFLLQFNGLIQLRYIFNHRNGRPPLFGDDDWMSQGDHTKSGFEFNRAKLEFGGYIGDPRIKYLVRIGIDREDNEVLGERIVLGYDLLPNLRLWAGEDKAPFLREEMIDAGRQLAVERSLVNEVFTAGYVQGLWTAWEPTDFLNLTLSFNDGLRSGEADNEYAIAYLTRPVWGGVSGNTHVSSLHKPFSSDMSDGSFTFRIDGRLAGDWRQFADFSSWSGEPLAIFAGAAVHWERGETGNLGPNNNFVTWTADASLEYQGFNFYTAFVQMHNHSQDSPDRWVWGVVAQGGYMLIPDKLEVFARFEYMDLDADRPFTFASFGGRPVLPVPNPGADGIGSLDDEVMLVTAGVNYYLIKHKAKLSADMVWALDQIPTSTLMGLQDDKNTAQTLGMLGLLHDAARSENQFAIRIQFQLMY